MSFVFLLPGSAGHRVLFLCTPVVLSDNAAQVCRQLPPEELLIASLGNWQLHVTTIVIFLNYRFFF